MCVWEKEKRWFKIHKCITLQNHLQQCSVCDPNKTMFFTSKFRFFFPSLQPPPIKLKLGQQIGGGTTNSKPAAGPIIILMMGQLVVRSHLLHSFLEVHSVAVPFTSHPQSVQLCEELKPFCWAKLAHFDFPSPDFTLHYHILSTAEDVLTHMKIQFVKQ